MVALIGLLQALAAVPAPSPAGAQADTIKQSGLCWRARPAPHCRWIIVTDFGMSRSSRDEYEPRVDLDLGFLAVVSRRSAVGGTLLFSADESHHRSGLLARYRRWVTPQVAVDLGAGPVSYCELAGPEGCGDRGQSGVQVQGSAYLSGLLAVSATFEHLGAAGAEPSEGMSWSLAEVNRWYVGVTFGSYAGPIALLGLAVLTAATWN